MIFQNNRSHDQPQKRQKAFGKLTPNPKATLQQQVHEVMRFFHYSPRTEETYWQWVVRFLRHHKRPGVEGGGGVAASARIGGGGGAGIPDASGGGVERERLDAESGVERAGLFV